MDKYLLIILLISTVCVYFIVYRISKNNRIKYLQEENRELKRHIEFLNSLNTAWKKEYENRKEEYDEKFNQVNDLFGILVKKVNNNSIDDEIKKYLFDETFYNDDDLPISYVKNTLEKISIYRENIKINKTELKNNPLVFWNYINDDEKEILYEVIKNFKKPFRTMLREYVYIITWLPFYMKQAKDNEEKLNMYQEKEIELRRNITP